MKNAARGNSRPTTTKKNDLKKVVVVDLDASGSMSGARTTEALEGVGTIRKVLRSEDHVAVYAFNDTTTCVTPLCRRPSTRYSRTHRSTTITTSLTL